MKARRFRTAAALAMLTLLTGVSAGDVPQPQLARGTGEQCVEPIEIIRRDHMKFLHHQRDDTVHFGIRTKRHSLVGCVDCHAAVDTAGEFIPVNAPEQFCASCHAYVAAKLDCFECHATTPSGNGTHR